MKLKKLDKSSKNIILRSLLFLVFLLVIFPAVMLLFIKAPNFQFQLRNIFLLQRMNKIFALIVLLFIFLSFPKIKKLNPCKLISKKSAIYFSISIVLFLSSFATQGDIDKILNEGVSFENGDVINFDGERWFSLSVLSDKNIRKDAFLYLEHDNMYLRKEVLLNEIPESAKIVWHGIVFGEPEAGDLESECKVYMSVNENVFDVSSKFLELDKNKPGWMSIKIRGNNFVEGKNNLKLTKKCDYAIALSTQEVYSQYKSYIFKGNNERMESFNEFVWYIETENSVFFKVLFKLGFIFRVLGIIALFMAVFGFDFTRKAVKISYKELLFSSVFAYLMYVFAVWLENQWIYLSKIVTYAVYFLLKISFLKPVVDFSDPLMPMLSISGFAIGIVDKCSGVEGIAYFLIAYTALLVFNWRRINLKKALIMYIPGIIGIFLFNIIRIYLIIIIGAFISPKFAMNSFHTNIGIVIFIIYLLVFWPLAGRYFMKK